MRELSLKGLVKHHQLEEEQREHSQGSENSQLEARGFLDSKDTSRWEDQ